MEDTETFDKPGATRLASSILTFWTYLGLEGVKAWVEEVPDNPGFYQVRSNVVELIRECLDRNALLQRAGNSTLH